MRASSSGTRRSESTGVATPSGRLGTLVGGTTDDVVVVDAGTVDAGTVDAGTVDAGTVVAGTVDAGTVVTGAWALTIRASARAAGRADEIRAAANSGAASRPAG